MLHYQTTHAGIVIPNWRPKNRNKMTGRSAAFALRDEKKKIASIATQAMQALSLPVATTPKRVHIVIVGDTRSRVEDEDNLEACRKSVLDALSMPKGRKTIGVGLIVDDSPDWCTATVSKEIKNPHFTGTIICLYDVGVDAKHGL